MKRYLWIHTDALFQSGYYQGQATLTQAAEMYPEHTIQTKFDARIYGDHYVPVVSLKRVDPYDPYIGTTEWHDAANELLRELGK